MARQQIIEDDDPPIVKRVMDGRTRAGKLAKAQQATDQAEAAAIEGRPQQRTVGQRGARIAVRGRNGEVLTRKRSGTHDPYEGAVPPPGWKYQWNAVSVIGNKEIMMDQSLEMEENGWRPVPASRHPGLFMPVGSTGSIIRGGLRLDERPEELDNEAREEELRKARKLVSDRNESLMLTGLKGQMRDGFEMSKKYRGTGGDVRMSIDKGLDIPAPAYKLADPGE